MLAFYFRHYEYICSLVQMQPTGIFGFQALNQGEIYFSELFWLLVRALSTFANLTLSPKEKVFHSQRFSQKQNWKIHDTQKDIGIFKGIPSKHIDTFCKIWTLLQNNQENLQLHS